MSTQNRSLVIERLSFIFLSPLLDSVAQQLFNWQSMVILCGERVLGTRRFSVHIPEDLADWLEREAVRQGRTRNNLIKWILEQYRRKPKGVETEEVNEQE